MLLNRRGEYAILGLIHLAKKARDLGVNRLSDVGEVAEAASVPANLLRVLFYQLTKDGILRSQRGVGGGFTLGEPAKDITLRRIIESVQGPITPFCCVTTDTDPDDCNRFGECELYGVLRRVRSHVIEEFEKNTLATLIECPTATSSPSTQQPFVV